MQASPSDAASPEARLVKGTTHENKRTQESFTARRGGDRGREAYERSTKRSHRHRWTERHRSRDGRHFAEQGVLVMLADIQPAPLDDELQVALHGRALVDDGTVAADAEPGEYTVWVTATGEGSIPADATVKGMITVEKKK